jgi:hypothetical protein
MLEKQEIQLKKVTTSMKNDRVLVNIKIDNPLDRTLYAYAKPRRILYNNATGKLTLALHDQHLAENVDYIRDIHQPHMVPLEGKTETEIKLDLPPVINRLRPASERGNGPLTEQLRIAEATEIDIEIAHQDTPFYYDPKKSNVRQFKEWGNTVAKANFKVAPLKPREETKPKPKDRK